MLRVNRGSRGYFLIGRRCIILVLVVDALADALPEFHDVFDLVPDFLHDALVGLVLLIDFVHCASLTHVFIGLY